MHASVDYTLTKEAIASTLGGFKKTISYSKASSVFKRMPFSPICGTGNFWQPNQNLSGNVCKKRYTCLCSKAWLVTYFDLPQSQLRKSKALRTRAQLAFLMVTTRNCKRNFIIKGKNMNIFWSLGCFFFFQNNLFILGETLRHCPLLVLNESQNEKNYRQKS